MIIAIYRLAYLVGRWRLVPFRRFFEERGKCVYRTSRKRIPLIDPRMNRVRVADIIVDRHSNQALAPLPVPPAVFIQRIKYLPEQIVVLAKSQITQALHEQFVDERFEHQV